MAPKASCAATSTPSPWRWWWTAEVQIGVLGCPNLAEAHRPDLGGPGSLVVAVRGEGAWTTSLASPGEYQRLSVSAQADPAQARLLRSFESGHTNVSQIDVFAQALGIQAEPVLMDSQAKYAVLAAGKGDLLLRLLSAAQPNYREKIWDQAAGSLVLEEAGGRITDLDGVALDFTTGRSLRNNRGILASNHTLHAAALQALAPDRRLTTTEIESEPKTQASPMSRSDRIAILLSLLAVLAAYWVHERIFERMAHIEDEMAYVWQAQAIAGGHLTLPSPPDTKKLSGALCHRLSRVSALANTRSAGRPCWPWANTSASRPGQPAAGRFRRLADLSPGQAPVWRDGRLAGRPADPDLAVLPAQLRLAVISPAWPGAERHVCLGLAGCLLPRISPRARGWQPWRRPPRWACWS